MTKTKKCDTITHGELFAGIAGFGLGFEQAGIKTVWHVEIDKHCQGVLERHYPDTLILSDVRECGAHNLPPVDIISFGSPCQDLSVAGKRKGLIDGEKSSLFFEAIRIVGELKPTFGVWENVPGAFSSNSGRDFAAVLSAFRDIGASDIAWTVLDAQYFGVAQRRRRIFLVADFRGERAAEILFESSRSAWHSAPSRETGSQLARDVAASLRSGGAKSGTRLDSETGLVAHALTACKTATGRLDPSEQDVVTFTQRGRDGEVAIESQENLSYPLRPSPASSKSTMIAYGVSENQRAECNLTEYSRQITSGGGKPGQGYPCILAWHENQGGEFAIDPDCIAKAVKAQASHSYQGVCVNDGSPDTECIAIQHASIGRKPEAGPQGKGWRDDGVNWTLDSTGEADAVVFGIRDEQTPKIMRGLCPTLESRSRSGGRMERVAGGFGVRRLTPTECERLQGFPDGWTNRQSDTQRYRQLGNAVAVPCSKWIGERIVRVYDS